MKKCVQISNKKFWADNIALLITDKSQHGSTISVISANRTEQDVDYIFMR